MKQTLTVILLAMLFACVPTGPNLRTLARPKIVGETIDSVPGEAWEKCKDQVRKDLKYDPRRAEFTLTSSEIRAVETDEFAVEMYGPLLWRFDAELLASNAFGALVRASLRCYIAFPQNSQDITFGPFIHFAILTDDEDGSNWEQE